MRLSLAQSSWSLAPSAVAFATISYRRSVHPERSGFLIYREFEGISYKDSGVKRVWRWLGAILYASAGVLELLRWQYFSLNV